MEWLGLALESAKDFNQINIFGALKKKSLQDSYAKTGFSIKNLRPHFHSQFFLSFHFYIDHKTLRGLETYLNCV